MSSPIEHLEFQAEARQLLNLMIHSIYTNKDAFLRELISNSSDALDKLKIEAYRNKDLHVDTSDLCIEIKADPQERMLTVQDNGIGMSHDEVIDLIGTLAKSGTEQLRQQLSQAHDSQTSAELIGQFGIGFYSVFMVADRVELLTRKAGEHDGTRWESCGDGTYTIQTVDHPQQGTTITLHLKDVDTDNELHDYTDEHVLRQLVKKYSDFISWPIRMEVHHIKPPTTEDGQPEEFTQVETLNSMKALWARPRNEVSEEEYQEFYKHISHSWDNPLEIITLQAEGTFEYQALLFIPSHASFDLFTRDATSGIQLYVKRVFVMADCDQLMPEYLRFITGVVDAADMSLNVSREILQQDRQINAIRRRLTKKVLSCIKDIQTHRDTDYQILWNQFGRVLKEGLLSDIDNREALLGICSFPSTHDENHLTTLAGYVERMKETQTQIFFATGESREQLIHSPHLEAFRAKGLEVLLLTDPIDEIWVDIVGEFEGKPLQSVAKGQVDLDTPEEKQEHERQRKEQETEFASLMSWLTTHLDQHVKEVRLSTRLTDSPACLITDSFEITPSLAQLYRASGQQITPPKRILELNPTHPFIVKFHQAYLEHPDEPTLADMADILYDVAVLAEGGTPDDPAHFSSLLVRHLTQML